MQENETKIKSVDVVIPVYNEEGNLAPLTDRLLKAMQPVDYDFRLLFVDDGSSDSSVSIIRRWIEKYPKNIGLICLNRNYGQHAAIIAAFENCNADVVVTIDADLQNPPEAIPKLIEKVQEGYDVVGSIRGGGRKDKLFRKTASFAKDHMVRKITNSNMRDSGCMLRAYRLNIVKAVLMCRERFVYIPALANTFAKRSTEIVVEHSERAAGESKYNVWKLMQLFFDILTGSTFMPLRFLTVLGGVMCMVSVCFGILLIFLRIVYGAIWGGDGIFTLFGILFFFVGLQFLAMGILGEYICRISMDVRERPKYFIMSKEGSVVDEER